jgi:Zn-dependent protease
LNLDLVGLLTRAIAGALALTLHEFAHAWTAFRLGDDTAARQGRLTLDPRAHLDPLGYILVVLFGFGWARPVPVSPWRLRPSPSVGNALVAAAGPFTNLALAFLLGLVFRLGLLDGAPVLVRQVVIGTILLNIVLFIFNLIPLAPLDGISVLSGIVGPNVAQRLTPLYTYGPQILLGLLLLAPLLRINVLGAVMNPLTDALTRLILGL